MRTPRVDCECAEKMQRPWCDTFCQHRTCVQSEHLSVAAPFGPLMIHLVKAEIHFSWGLSLLLSYHVQTLSVLCRPGQGRCFVELGRQG